MGNRESLWYGELAAERFRQSGERAFQHASRMTAAGAAASAISRALDNRNYLPPLSKNIQYTPAKPQPDPRVDQLVKNMAVMAGFMLSESRHQEEDTRQVNSQLGELRGQLHDIMSRPAPEPQVHVEVVPIVIQAPPPPEPKEPPKPTINKDPDVLDQSENPHKELVLAALRSGVLVKVPQRLLLAKLISEGVPLELPLNGQMPYERPKRFFDYRRENSLGEIPSRRSFGFNETVTDFGEAIADGEGKGRPGKLTGALAMNDNELNLTITTPANLAGNILGVGREDKRGQMELRFFPIEESQRDLYKQTSLGRLDQIANAYLPARAWPVDGLEGQVMADLLMDSVLRDCEDPKLAGAWRKFLDQYGGKIPTSARFSIESSLSSQPEPKPEPAKEVEAATPGSLKRRKKTKKESDNIDDPHKAEIMKAVKNGTFVKIPEDVVKTMIAKAGPEGRWSNSKFQPANVLNLQPTHIYHDLILNTYAAFIKTNEGINLEVHASKYAHEWKYRILTGLGIERSDGSYELDLKTVGGSEKEGIVTVMGLTRPETIVSLYAPTKGWYLENKGSSFYESLVINLVSKVNQTEAMKWRDYLRTHGKDLNTDFRLRIEAALF